MIPRRLRRSVLAALVVAALGLAGRYVWQALKPPPAPLPPSVHLTIAVREDQALDTLAVSPDGQSLAYTAESADGSVHLFIKSPFLAPEREIAIGADSPFFSPDGKWVAYFATDAIWKSPVANGGERQKVCAAPGAHAGGTWTDDGRIVFAPLGGQGLMVVRDAGGTGSRLTTLNKQEFELAHGWPHAVPGGGIIFTVAQRGRDAHLEALSASNRRGGQRLVPVIGQAQYESTGHLVYSYLGDLYAVPFDPHEMKTRGVPVAMARGVQTMTGFGQLGRSGFALSPNGTLVWLPGSVRDAESELVKTGYDGRPIARLNAPAATYQTPRLASDGKRLAVVVRSSLMTRNIEVLDLVHPENAPHTVQGGDNQSPAWMPDGRLSFASNRDGLQRIYVTSIGAGIGAPKVTPLFSMDVASPRNPASWTRQPPLLALYEIDPFRSRDVMVYRVGEAILPVAATNANERSPWLSPDGREMAYVSDVSGRDEVYVKTLDGLADARQISTRGGVEPVWTRDGLFHREGDDLFLNGSVAFAGRRFEKDPGANAAAYDVSPKGRFLIMLKSVRRPGEIRVVKNWGTELVRESRK
jgi:eukaryotic-like serine/threonine-protein kinase